MFNLPAGGFFENNRTKVLATQNLLIWNPPPHPQALRNCLVRPPRRRFLAPPPHLRLGSVLSMKGGGSSGRRLVFLKSKRSKLLPPLPLLKERYWYEFSDTTSLLRKRYPSNSRTCWVPPTRLSLARALPWQQRISCPGISTHELLVSRFMTRPPGRSPSLS